MNAIGDPHNFHLRVTLHEDQFGLFVQKPRTIYWEYLFLDHRSSFRKLLRSSPKNSLIDFDNLLGNIHITSSDEFRTGFASHYQSIKPEINEVWFRRLGQLLGFVTIFGITDLHKNNVLASKNTFQLVDIECL